MFPLSTWTEPESLAWVFTTNKWISSLEPNPFSTSDEKYRVVSFSV